MGALQEEITWEDIMNARIRGEVKEAIERNTEEVTEKVTGDNIKQAILMLRNLQISNDAIVSNISKSFNVTEDFVRGLL